MASSFLCFRLVPKSNHLVHISTPLLLLFCMTPADVQQLRFYEEIVHRGFSSFSDLEYSVVELEHNSNTQLIIVFQGGMPNPYVSLSAHRVMSEFAREDPFTNDATRENKLFKNCHIVAWSSFFNDFQLLLFIPIFRRIAVISVLHFPVQSLASPGAIMHRPTCRTSPEFMFSGLWPPALRMRAES